MKPTDLSRQRGQGAPALGDNDAGSPGTGRVSWIVAAAVMVGLAVIVIVFFRGSASEPATASRAARPAEQGDRGSVDRQTAPAPVAVPPVGLPDAALPSEEGESDPPRQASPDEISAYQQALARRIAGDRNAARQGDLLDAELVAFLENVTGRLVEGDDGEKLLATLRESNPGYELEEGEVRPTLAVNAPYPDDAPLSTVPPPLLAAYPPLPEGVEYRFVGCRLVLLNRDARLILDYTNQCLW